MKSVRVIIYQDEEFVTAQCLDVDVASFGSTKEEALANLKEALELYFENEEDLVKVLV